jgi:hypothetical protein
LPLCAIEVNRGLLAQARIGNLFKQVIFDNAYLDIYYQLEVEQEDSLGFRTLNPDYDIDRALLNTQRFSHTIAATLCYQLNNNWQFEGTLQQTIFGKNTEHFIYAGCNIQYNF